MAQSVKYPPAKPHEILRLIEVIHNRYRMGHIPAQAS